MLLVFVEELVLSHQIMVLVLHGSRCEAQSTAVALVAVARRLHRVWLHDFAKYELLLWSDLEDVLETDSAVFARVAASVGA